MVMHSPAGRMVALSWALVPEKLFGYDKSVLRMRTLCGLFNYKTILDFIVMKSDHVRFKYSAI